MKKLIVATLSLVTLSAFANTSANLTLKGSIAAILDISIVSEPLASALPLDQAVNNQKIGTVIEKSNHRNGYKVSASSQYRGKLKFDNENFVNYSLKYGNTEINLSAPSSVVAVHGGQGEFSHDIKISYAKPSEYLAAGEYTDMVTFTISAE